VTHLRSYLGREPAHLRSHLDRAGNEHQPPAKIGVKFHSGSEIWMDFCLIKYIGPVDFNLSVYLAGRSKRLFPALHLGREPPHPRSHHSKDPGKTSTEGRIDCIDRKLKALNSLH